MLLLLLLWMYAVRSADITVDHPEGCNIIEIPSTGVIDYYCRITPENMETVLTVFKQPHIQMLSVEIDDKLGNVVFDDTCFSKDLIYLSIVSTFPFYIHSQAFNASSKLIYLDIRQTYTLPYVEEARALGNTTIVKKNVNWTSPTFGPGWLTPITGIRTLDLRNSNFSSFRSGEFCELQQLQKLDLSNNRIQHTEGLGITCNSLNTSFVPCLPNVTNLIVSNNPIKTININIADNLPRLRNLGISHCLLSTLNLEFILSSKLERLEMNNNRLQSLVTDCQHFRNESRLTVLLLQNNQLQNLSNKLFTCMQQLQHLDLSTNSLTADVLIHAGLNTLTDLTWLDLSYNKVEYMPPTLIGNFTELIEFYCSGCRIQRIGNETFSELRRLKVLKLDKNKLYMIESSALLHLDNLHILDLSENHLSETTFIRSLPYLEELFLGRNKLLEVPDFSGSSWVLSTLILDRNNISKVDTQHLSGLSKLRKISLAFNRIQHVKDYTFKYLSNLVELVLNDNMIKTIGYYGLDNISHLTHLRLDNNILTVFPPIKPINLLFLQTLNLSRNLIGKFTFNGAHIRLQVIDLSQNNISKMTVPMLSFPKLRVLDLGYNNIQVLDKKYFNTMATPRTEVFLRGNPLHCDCDLEWLLDTKLNLMIFPTISEKEPNKMYVPSTLDTHRLSDTRKLSYVQIPDLDMIQCGTSPVNSGKLLSTLNHDDFRCTYTNICIRSLCMQKCCMDKGCSCRTFCYPKCICYFTNDNNINYMNCSFRHITALPPQRPTSVRTLSLDGNNVSSLNSLTLNFPYLEVLYVNKSHVSHLGVAAFSNLKLLKILDLHQNEIEIIRTDIFSNISRLEELYLQENKVQFIESDSFSDLWGLKALALHKNNMKYVNLTVFDELDSLTELTLHDNPWVCDCLFGPVFQKWLVSNSEVVSIPTEIYCRNSLLPESTNTLYQPVLNIDFSVCNNLTIHTHVEYRHSKSVVEGFSLAVAFAVLVTIFLLLYINRFLLRVWMYNKYGLCFHPEDNDNKEYDVFIAYSKADDLLVARELLPELEQGQMSYKVCIEGRDCPVGPPTADIIIAAIQKSKRTVLLVSENYFDTQWCEYSFDAGLYQVLSDKQIRLLIILTNKDFEPRMTPSMKLYLKMNPFLVIGEKWFWRKLRYYLPHNPQGADVVTGRQFNLMEVY